MNLTPIRLLCVTLVLMSSNAGPAFASSPLQLSLDGVHWTDAISDPLFNPSMRWVPGDSEQATFFIRNHGGSAGDLTVDLLGSSAGKLLDSGSLHITAKGGGGAWTSVSAPGRHRLLSAPHVADGQIEPIAVNAVFDAAANNRSQLHAAKLAFRVTLSESTSDSPLPNTGAPDLRWYAALSAILIGIGLALVSRRNESPRKVHHV
ncbi:MAG: putative cell surface protein [Aeromicrobium sp.]|nr:putative cell surface protein [Aeromicrobium sp.]